MLAELGLLALQGTSIQDLMNQAVCMLAEALDVEYTKVMELSESGNELLLRSGIGWRDGLVGQAYVSAEVGSQAGYTLSVAEPVIVRDLQEEQRFAAPDLLLSHNVVSGMSVVIHGQTIPFGVLGVHTRQQREFSEAEVDLLQAMANVLAHAVQQSRTHASLIESENRYRSVVNALSEGVMLFDQNTRLLAHNTSAARILGLTEEQMTEDSLVDGNWKTIHEDGSAVASEDHPAVRTLRSGVPVDNQILGMQTPKGELSWISVNSRPLFRDGEQRPFAVVASFEDITQRKQAERERESRLWHLQVMDRLNEVIVTADDVDMMLDRAMALILQEIGCDRAWISHPADPHSDTFTVRVEQYRQEDRDDKADGYDFTVEARNAEAQTRQLANMSPLEFREQSLPALIDADSIQRFQIRSMLLRVLRPRRGQARLLGIHQSGYDREWTEAEKNLLQDVSRRLEDALSSLIALRELRESERSLAQSQEIARVGNWQFDLSTCQLSGSAELLRIVGIAKNEALPTLDSFIRAYVHPHDRDFITRSHQDAVSTSVTESVEFRIVHPAQKSVCHVRAKAEVITDQNGLPQKLVGTLQDITDYKQAEERIRFQSQLLDSVQESIVATDLSGNITYWGRGAESLYGYSSEEVKGKPITIIVEAHEEHLERERMRQVRENGSWRGQYQQRRNDGSKFWSDTFISLVTDESGVPNGYVGIDRDISSQQRAECDLRASEAKFRVLSEKSPAIVLIAQNDRLVYCNPAGVAVTGYAVEELLGMRFTDIVHADYRRLVVDRHRQRLRGETVPARYEIEIVTKSGADRWLDLAAEVIDFEGSTAVLVNCIDVTERKLAEQRLHEIEKQLAHVSRLSTMGEMVAGIAHEINQPLYAISNLAAACRHKLEAMDHQFDAPVETWLQQVSQQAVRCGEIVRNLRRFVNRNDRERTWVDLNNVVRDSVALVRNSSHQQTVFDCHLPNPAPRVYASEVQLQQVVVNLLRNACDATSACAAPKVDICVKSADDRAQVTVRDNGMGFEEQQRDSLFEAFFTTKPEGLGMGLAISKSIIDAHCGKLHVDPGTSTGAAFHIELPLSGSGKSQQP